MRTSALICSTKCPTCSYPGDCLSLHRCRSGRPTVPQMVREPADDRMALS